MGSIGPPSATSSASLLLPSLTPAADNWFFRSTSDDLLTQALTRELRSTSASSSSSSRPTLESSPASASNYSDGLFHLQSLSNLSQVGSPLSSDSVSKDQPESPFNYPSSVLGMSTTTLDAITESCITQHYQAPQTQGRHSKAASPLIQAPCTALSSQAAAGAGASKVSKRRARTNKKVPIAVLSADTSNFRAMVQQLTGIPTPQALPNLWGGHGGPLLKPQPTRFSPLDLPTLDTSASFLALKNVNPFLQQPGQQALSGLLASELSHLQGKGKPFLGTSYFPSIINYDALLATSPFDVLATANLNGNWAKGDVKHPSAANMGKEGEHRSAAPSSTSIESFLMGDDDQYPKLSYNSVDSWLAFDGGAIANHSPRVDLAKIAS